MDEDRGGVPLPDNVGKETNETFFGSGEEEVNSLAAVSPLFVCQRSKVNQEKVGGPRFFKGRKGLRNVSPVGSPPVLRPKKRSRAHLEKSDIFGLDELINKGPYPFQNVKTVEVHVTDDYNVPEGGDSLDLNRRASSSQGQPTCETGRRSGGYGKDGGDARS
ncbi:hypothetical protein Hanom_Chr12g01110111 [Helianthus anomalus]